MAWTKYILIGLLIMAIARDTTSNSGAKGAISSFNWNHTCTGSNLVLPVGVCIYKTSNSDDPDPSVTYDGTSMTKSIEYQNTGNRTYVAIFTLANPSTGSNPVAVTINGDTPIACAGGATSFTGCDTTSPVNASGTDAGSKTDFNVVQTTTATTMGLCAIISALGNATKLVGDQTEEWQIDLGGQSCGGEYQASGAAGSRDQGWSNTASDDGAIAAVWIAEASAGGGRTTKNTDSFGLGMRHGESFRLPNLNFAMMPNGLYGLQNRIAI